MVPQCELFKWVIYLTDLMVSQSQHVLHATPYWTTMEYNKSTRKRLDSKSLERSVAHWLRHSVELEALLDVNLECETPNAFDLIKNTLREGKNDWNYSDRIERHSGILHLPENIQNFSDPELQCRRVEVLLLNVPQVLSSERPVIDMEYNLERLHNVLGSMGYPIKLAWPLWKSYWENWLSAENLD